MVDLRQKFAINGSSAKAQFAFSKSSRFPNPKSYTDAFGYEVKEGFKHPGNSGDGRAFLASENRFGYDEVRRSDGRDSCGAIDGPGLGDPRSNTYTKKTSYSFGVSRRQMKKLHVDEILRNATQQVSPPGPGNY